ncbi:MAG TPA: hypothetical protein VIS73_04595, partial [Rhodocyclaceae bacterium]
MAWFDLQSQASQHAPAFDSAESAKKWLGSQSQTVPARMQIALAEQFEALHGAGLPPLELARILSEL